MSGRWNEAQRLSILQWRQIYDSIGRRDALAIVAELNEVGELCQMARERAGGGPGRCRYCVVFADAEQCADARLDISAYVINGEIDKARLAARAVIERIEAARLPELR